MATYTIRFEVDTEVDRSSGLQDLVENIILPSLDLEPTYFTVQHRL